MDACFQSTLHYPGDSNQIKPFSLRDSEAFALCVLHVSKDWNISLEDAGKRTVFSTMGRNLSSLLLELRALSFGKPRFSGFDIFQGTDER